MRALIFALVLLSSSVACAQYGYTPIEQSRSYRSIGRYNGPVYPYGGGYGYSPYYQRYMYVPPTIRVQVSQDPLDPLWSNGRRGSMFYGR